MVNHTQTQKDPEQLKREQAAQRSLLEKIAQDRDEQAFAELFDIYAPKIKAFGLKSSPGAELMAEDLVQEVMIKVWNKAHLFNGELAGASTWIFTMARNTRIDQIRKNKHAASEIDADDLYEVLEDDQPGPFQSSHNKQTEDMIREHLNDLPKEQAQVIAKTYLEGKSHSEAAAELGLPLGTVKSRVRIAIEKLSISLRGLNND